MTFHGVFQIVYHHIRLNVFIGTIDIFLDWTLLVFKMCLLPIL